jgi:hypothetical protein
MVGVLDSPENKPFIQTKCTLSNRASSQRRTVCSTPRKRPQNASRDINRDQACCKDTAPDVCSPRLTEGCVRARYEYLVWCWRWQGNDRSADAQAGASSTLKQSPTRHHLSLPILLYRTDCSWGISLFFDSVLDPRLRKP